MPMRVAIWMGVLALAANLARAEVTEGMIAPPIQLQDQDGQARDVAEQYGRGWTALVFYPKDDTAGCTAEACNIRDNFAALTDARIQLYGISLDEVGSKHNFQQKYSLAHTLLADPTKAVCTAYGTLLDRGFSARVTFLLDEARIVRFVNRQVRPQSAGLDILAKVNELRAADEAAALAKLGERVDSGLGFTWTPPVGWTAGSAADGQALAWTHPDDPAVWLTVAALRPEPDTLTVEAMRAAMPPGVEPRVVEAVTIAGQPAIRADAADADGAVTGVRFILGGRDVTLSLRAPKAAADAAARLLAMIAAGCEAL